MLHFRGLSVKVPLASRCRGMGGLAWAGSPGCTLGIAVTANEEPHTQAQSTSRGAFPDGARWRIEIPSVEGPDALQAVVDEAASRSVRVHRVSQGSGILMLSDAEIEAMASIGREHDIEVCLWAGSRSGWETGAPTPAASALRGADAVKSAIEEVERAAALGIRSVLVSDLGLLAELAKARRDRIVPTDLTIKVSIMAAPVNPASFALLAGLGADTINVPSDMTVGQLAELRGSSGAIIDFYVEAPGNVGGQVRYRELADIVEAAAPVHLKFGLRNAPDVYPTGAHIHATVIACSRERVRRAQLAVERLTAERRL